MTNNNVPQNLHTESNQGLSITGPVESLLLSLERTVNNDPREIVVIHDANTTEGSQDNPIMVESIPEQTISVTPKTRNSGPRRNVGPPQFYGNRRFIDVVQEKDDLGASTTLFSPALDSHSSTFSVNSPSNLLTPLAEAAFQTDSRRRNYVVLVFKELPPDGQTCNIYHEDSLSREFFGLKFNSPDLKGPHTRGGQL